MGVNGAVWRPPAGPVVFFPVSSEDAEAESRNPQRGAKDGGTEKSLPAQPGGEPMGWLGGQVIARSHRDHSETRATRGGVGEAAKICYSRDSRRTTKHKKSSGRVPDEAHRASE